MRYSTLIRWLFSSLIGTSATYAQVSQTNRFEALLPASGESFSASSLGYDGVLLHRPLQREAGQHYEIIKLDTAFKHRWSGIVPLEQGYTVTNKKVFGTNLYILSRSANYRHFHIVEVNCHDEKYVQWSFRNYIAFAPTEFEVTDHGVIIGGYYNRTPVVVFFSFDSRQVKILPGLFNEIGELTQIKTYDDHTFDILLSARYFSKNKTIWIKSYTQQGEFINQQTLPTEGNRNLLFGRVLKTSDDRKIVAGVYGNRNSEFSRGIFMAALDTWGNQQLRLYSYADLDNFFGYMKARREQRVKDRIERRKESGKKNNLHYRLLVHEIIPYQEQFVLLGEAFHPKYKSVSSSRSSGFFAPGSPYSGNQVIFDGYRYTHATLLGFDKEGHLLWDNTFEINDVKTFQKEQFVKLNVGVDRLTLLYLYNNKLRTKVISGQQVLESKTMEPLKTLSGYVSPESISLNKLDYWYDNILFAYGVQEIVDAHAKGGRETSRVFFINKLKCR